MGLQKHFGRYTLIHTKAGGHTTLSRMMSFESTTKSNLSSSPVSLFRSVMWDLQPWSCIIWLMLTQTQGRDGIALSEEQDAGRSENPLVFHVQGSDRLFQGSDSLSTCNSFWQNIIAHVWDLAKKNKSWTEESQKENTLDTHLCRSLSPWLSQNSWKPGKLR